MTVSPSGIVRVAGVKIKLVLVIIQVSQNPGKLIINKKAASVKFFILVEFEIDVRRGLPAEIPGIKTTLEVKDSF